MKLKHCAALLASAALAWPFVVSAENYHWDSVAIGGGGFVTGLIPAKSEAGVFYARTDVGGAYRWNPATSRWIALNDWTSPADVGLMGIESLAVDPHNAAKVYMVAGTSYYNNGKTAVLRSSDYGATFTVTDVSTQFKAHGNGMGRQNGEKLQVDPGNGNLLYAGTRRDGLFRSSDAGASWSRLTGFPVTSTPNDNGVSFVLLDAASVQGSAAQRIFVGVSRLPNAGPNLYVSTNGGTTFSAVTGGPANLMPQRAAISPNGKLYITYANGAGPHPGTNEAMDAGQIWEYNAANGAWTNITPSGFTRAFGGISIDPANPQRLVAATINTWMQQGTTSNYGDRIFISTNAGRNWTDVIQRGFAVDPKGANWINNSSIHWTGSIEFDPSDTNKVWVISGNGVFRTPNINATTTTWAFDVAGLEETVPFNFISIPNGPLVSVIGDFDGFSNANPAQYGTRFTPVMGTTTDLAVASLDTRIMARVGNDLYTTTNSGASWTKAAALNGSKGQLALSADGFALLHTPADTSTTYRSTNYGASWVQVTGLNVLNARPVADPVNPSKFYAYDNGRLLASVDGGASFTPKATLAGGGNNLVRTAPGREGDVWVCLNGGGLARSIDSGVTFTKIASVNQCGAVGFGKAAPQASYPTVYLRGKVGNTDGVLRSTDAGATWVRVNDDKHRYGGPAGGQMITGDMNVFGRLYMNTSGRGIAYGQPVASGGEVLVTPVVAGPSTTTPQPANQCSYTVTSSWAGGYNAAIRITNNRSSTINGWTVSWTYTDNSVVNTHWNANVTGNSPTYTATPSESWSQNIAPGSSVEFGITVSGSAIPTVTGAACQ